MDFRNIESHIEMLERFRIALLPFTEWLDKPIKECFLAFPEEAYRHAPKRALLVFKQYGNGLHVVALNRKGEWITMRNERGIVELAQISSEGLAKKIDRARFAILESAPWGCSTEHLRTIEAMGLQTAIAHCAFLKYMEQGIEEIRRAILERENRVRIMRENLTFLASFVAGIDPLVYGGNKPMKTYAVFSKYPGHESRCTGSYFVRDLVQKQADERNAAKFKFDPDKSYFIFESSVRTDALRSFLDGVYHSVEETATSQGVFARRPLSEEEVTVIRMFANSIGNK